MNILITIICIATSLILLCNGPVNTNFIVQYLAGLTIGFILGESILYNTLKTKEEEIKLLLNDSAKQAFIIFILYLIIYNNDNTMKVNIMKKINQLFEIDFEDIDSPEKINALLEKIGNNEIFFKLIEKNGKLVYKIKEEINK